MIETPVRQEMSILVTAIVQEHLRIQTTTASVMQKILVTEAKQVSLVMMEMIVRSMILTMRIVDVQVLM